MMDERLKWRGKAKITVYNGPMIEGRVKDEVVVENTITTVGKTRLASALGGVSTKILYMAVGTGTNAPAASDIKLQTESVRAVVSRYDSGGTGSYITKCYLAPGVANIAIKELGWFAPDALYSDPSGKDQGTLIARLLYDHTKTSSESILVERTDTIT